ncbi:MAG: V-type ATPase subunit [Candidatus Eisenbacteria bacterium]|nr:V-type ATPase subunit [Candidatus Eisenbacteria bacterium]
MADDTRYAYAVARVRGLEMRLLDRQWIERLLTEDARGALKVLADSALQESMSGVERPEDIETGLIAAMADALQVVSSISPEPELIDLFRMRWDFRNVRSLIKASLLKRTGENIGLTDGPGTIPAATLEKAVSENNYAALPDVLVEAIRAAQDDYRDHGELARVDQVLDNALWTHQLDVAASHKNAFLVTFFRTEVDLINIRTFARIKQSGGDASGLHTALIEGGHLDGAFFAGNLGEPVEAFTRALEYGRYGRLADVFREWSPEKAYVLDRACDNVLLDLVDDARRNAYGVEPLVAYILTRQLEIKLVRTAITARLDGVSRETVEERLRAAHV